MRVPGEGASCLGVGRPGSGALPPLTARPLGGLPGPTTHWLWVRGGAGVLVQLALHNPHIWANSLKPVCFLCFLLFWCPLLPFIETGTLKIYTKMVLYMKNEIFDLKYPLHGV